MLLPECMSWSFSKTFQQLVLVSDKLVSTFHLKAEVSLTASKLFASSQLLLISFRKLQKLNQCDQVIPSPQGGKVVTPKPF